MKWLKTIVKRLICWYCKEDMDSKGQDNMSDTIGKPMCEDCYNSGR